MATRRRRPTQRGDEAATVLYRGPKVEPQPGQSKEDFAAEQKSMRAVRIPKEKRFQPAPKGTPERAAQDARAAQLTGPGGILSPEAFSGIRERHQAAEGRRRRRWERARPQRFRTAQDILGDEGQVPNARNLSNRQVSAAMGWGDQEGDAAVDWKTTRAPAEHMLENPPRWEDMHPKQQQRVLSAAADYGVTMQSARKAYTAQLQRGLIRDPQHASFYAERGQTAAGEDLPRERLVRSSEETETPFHVNAAANAITSPQMAFIQTKKTGEISYPNDDVAKAAINYSKAGMTGAEYEETFGPKPGVESKYPHAGYPANMSRAIDVVTKVLGGTPMREAWKPGGRPGSGGGDKVRPYYNAWMDPTHPEGNFFVSDTHSGAGGMAPHLAGTEHETKYLSIAGIHSMHDYIARQVNKEHGLTSVSRAQSLQWNQEKIESEDQGSASGMFGASSVEAMRPANRNVSQQQISPDIPERGA